MEQKPISDAQTLKSAASEMGRKGGKARVPKGLSMASRKRRKEISAMAVAARRAKRKEPK